MRQDKHGMISADALIVLEELCVCFVRLNVAQNRRIIRLRLVIRQNKPETHKTDELNKHLVTPRRTVCGLVAINERNLVFICTAALFSCFLNKRDCFCRPQGIISI